MHIYAERSAARVHDRKCYLCEVGLVLRCSPCFAFESVKQSTIVFFNIKKELKDNECFLSANPLISPHLIIAVIPCHRFCYSPHVYSGETEAFRDQAGCPLPQSWSVE